MMKNILINLQSWKLAKKLFFLGGSSLILSSCDHLEKNLTQQNLNSPTSIPSPQTASPSDFDEYSVVAGSLQAAASGVSGTGTLLFKEAVKFADNNFSLLFRLQEEASLTLLANIDNGLTNGATLSFSRAKDKGLKVQLSRGPESYDLSPDFTTIQSDTLLKVEVDMHAHGHVIVWVNDNQIGEYAFSLPLTNKRWGLALSRAEVAKAKVGKAKVEG